MKNYFFAQQGITGAVATSVAGAATAAFFFVQHAFAQPSEQAFFAGLSDFAASLSHSAFSSQHAFAQSAAQAFFTACALPVPQVPQCAFAVNATANIRNGISSNFMIIV